MTHRAIRSLLLASAAVAALAFPASGGTPPVKTPASPAKPAEKAPAKAADPVCGMSVETAKARTATFEGKTYYFCSSGCKEKFEKSPAQFTRK